MDILKIMVDKGANLNTPLTKPLPGRSGMDSGDTALNGGSTPLMRAARSGGLQGLVGDLDLDLVERARCSRRGRRHGRTGWNCGCDPG